MAQDDTTEPKTHSIGYKAPPETSRWKPRQSGKRAGGKTPIDLEEMLQRANSQKVSLQISGRTERKVSRGEAILEAYFRQAITGSVPAQKAIFKWAKRYLPKPSQPSRGDAPFVRPITQKEVDSWKAHGCLPAGCSGVLEEIGVVSLNKAKRLFDEKSKATKDSAKAG